MASTPDPAAPDGHDVPPAVGRGGLVRRFTLPAASTAVVATATVLGWVFAGPPADSAAVVPPGCPASFDPADAAPAPGYQAGVSGQLVPMVLPEPRGPVSARICRFEAPGGSGTRSALQRSTVVDPVGTAALAALMNEGLGGSPLGGSSACQPGTGPDVVIFRYKAGPPVRVDVLGGDSAHVRTSARTEFGRQDVVQAVDRLVCSAD